MKYVPQSIRLNNMLIWNVDFGLSTFLVLSTFWFVDVLACRRSVDVLACRRFGLSTFWFVDALVCRRFGLSTFWFVDVLVCRRFGLSTFRFVDVLVCRRFDQLPFEINARFLSPLRVLSGTITGWVLWGICQISSTDTGTFPRDMCQILVPLQH